jgi:DNA-binding NarL/FixJ family response regulator
MVDLAAAGQSNKQIARTLYLGEKTVETHLRRVFRKLEVANLASWPQS